MSLIVDEHRQYLEDQARVSAYREAVGEVVRPGDVVLDLGSGTGILGLLACRAGARLVYSIEQGGMIGLAREVSRANGFEGRMVFVKGHSTRVDLPEKVDVVVCDQIGRFGFEAGILQVFEDARRRFLKPGGSLIPSRIDLTVAPVECPEVWSQVEFWNSCPAGFDFRPARQWAANTGYPVEFVPEQLLGSPGILASINLPESTAAPFRGEACVVANKPGTLHGIGGWFTAQLSPSVTMTNSPLSADRIKRRNVFFPIDRPVELAPGDCVRARLRIVPSELIVTWKVEVLEGSQGQNGASPKARFSHSTLRGMLPTKEDLERTQPQFVPKLSSWGKARRSILELCDGNRPLSEIEQEVYRRHADLFRSPGEAAAFVAKVINRYSL